MKTIGHMTLNAYSLSMQMVRPFLAPWLYFRQKRGKEDSSRQQEKLGYASLARPSGPLIWIHSASVGETNAIVPLCIHLSKRGFEILLTTVTVTSAQVAKERLAEQPGICHQFAPLDVPSILSKFLQYWQPDLALFVESELWPSTISALQKRAIPIVVVNGRMSDRSFKRWRLFKRMTPALFGQIDHVLARGEEDLLRFQALGCRQVTITGNLKYDVPVPHIDAKRLKPLQAACKNRPFFLATSTHKGEEEYVILTHRDLAEHYPGMLTCIVPRHPDRREEIVRIAKGSGLKPELRSLHPVPSKKCDIYIADTLGELNLFYSIAQFAFIGGSLIPVGGHNPIEAVKLNCVVMHGPYTFNFREIYGVLSAADAQQEIFNSYRMAEIVHCLFDDPVQCAKLVHKAHDALNTLTGAMDQTLHALEPFLQQLENRDGQTIDHLNRSAAS